ncbi:hypothetical protein QBC38DRAFT_472797 [Podospora fimiseda]|uniref:Uncharacterized protein n=1 Tax=Podospora fimiseda TaxID=252190 RepID=A0AAN7BUU2_9PEZI|nr:hypothetical protein QBC38DRAFT_472797 [Podospora fimiseda]
MATNSIQIPVNDNEHTASLTACSSSKKTFVQCISKLRNRIFHTAAIERTNTASPATIVPPHPQLEAETLSKLYIPGSFPSDSSLILTRRLADKHAIFASKFDTLTHSFNLGLQVQGISDPKVAQDVLLRYHHKYNNQLQPDKGETEFNLIHKQLAQECLILASSLSRKICPGSRLKTCLDLVSALESTTTTRSLQHPQASDDDDDEDRDYGSEPTCSFGVEFHSRSQLFAYGISGNNAPSTPVAKSFTIMTTNHGHKVRTQSQMTTTQIPRRQQRQRITSPSSFTKKYKPGQTERGRTRKL